MDSQIIGVLVGGLIAYLATITTEERKRKYEMKRETYYKLIDVVLNARTAIPSLFNKTETPWTTEIFLKRAKTGKYKLETMREFVNYMADNCTNDPEILQNIKVYKDWAASYEAIKFKTKLCGNKRVVSEMDKWSKTIESKLFNWNLLPESSADEFNFRNEAGFRKALVALLEMTGPPQSPRDHTLWILANSDGKMKGSRLRRCAGMKLAAN